MNTSAPIIHRQNSILIPSQRKSCSNGDLKFQKVIFRKPMTIYPGYIPRLDFTGSAVTFLSILPLFASWNLPQSQNQSCFLENTSAYFTKKQLYSGYFRD